jgi:hypothetical protein
LWYCAKARDNAFAAIEYVEVICARDSLLLLLVQ